MQFLQSYRNYSPRCMIRCLILWLRMVIEEVSDLITIKEKFDFFFNLAHAFHNLDS